jgi:hypothetical protein
MIKVGLVGEDPNDTSSIQNLLEKRYKDHVQFYTLTKRIKGYDLDTIKIKKALPIEFEDKGCDLVIFVRDLDALESEKIKLKQRIIWFKELDDLVNNKGLLLLNIWELEALILGDIDAFNKLYKTTYSFKSNPMFQKEPKELLKQITYKSNRQFKESDCPDIFNKLNIDTILKSCSCFSRFINEFDKRLAAYE